MKKIIIGADKSGFPLKEALKEHLIEKGYEVEIKLLAVPLNAP